MERAFTSAKTATQALELLTADLKRFASSAAQLVMLPIIGAAEHIGQGLKIYPVLPPAERPLLAKSLTGRALTDESLRGGHLPEKVLATVGDDLDLVATIKVGAGADQDGNLLSQSLVLFDRSPPTLRIAFDSSYRSHRSTSQRPACIRFDRRRRRGAR